MNHVSAYAFTLSFGLPVIYFLSDWVTGVQNKTYDQSDLYGKIQNIIIYGIGASCVGQVLWYLSSGAKNDDAFLW